MNPPPVFTFIRGHIRCTTSFVKLDFNGSLIRANYTVADKLISMFFNINVLHTYTHGYRGTRFCSYILRQCQPLIISYLCLQSADALNTCPVCGGYRLLPCNMCNGSKKSVYRNNFTTELVTLKCMNCDEVGLVKCHAC